MHPVICHIGRFTIYSYGLMMVIAFLAASYLCGQKGESINFNTEYLYNLLFFTFLIGVLGARIFYVIEHIQYYIKHPVEIVMLQYGGLSWFGGLISGSLFAVIYIKLKKLVISEVFDLVAPFLAFGQAIGRIGCFLNGCCYGRHSEIGIYFPAHDAVLIPTQLYASFFLIVIFIILRFIQDKPHRRGAIFFTYLLLYSVQRFFIETLRADNPHILFGLTLFQLLCIAAFVISCLWFIFGAKNKKTAV